MDHELKRQSIKSERCVVLSSPFGSFGTADLPKRRQHPKREERAEHGGQGELQGIMLVSDSKVF
jgi:hypothetical protein